MNKFRYVYQNYVFKKDFSLYYFTLVEIEEGAIERINKSGMRGNGYICIAKNRYTELQDKNGKEIYEGDIVKIKGTYIGDNYIQSYNAQVIFENGSFNITGEASFDTLSVNTYYWEVIGNIYENKELLKWKS